eukprot:jgi/Ulvmu1/2497/UM138_0001.1
MIRATSSRSSWACHHRLGHGRSAGALSTSAARGYHTRRTTKVSSGLYEGTVERFVTEDEVDTALQHVAQQSEAWHQVSTAERIRILEDIRSRCIKCCIQLGRRGAKVTGYGPPTLLTKCRRARRTFSRSFTQRFSVIASRRRLRCSRSFWRARGGQGARQRACDAAAATGRRRG